MRGATAALVVVAALAAGPQRAAAGADDAYCKALDAYLAQVDGLHREDVYRTTFFPDGMVACTAGDPVRGALCTQISQGGSEFPDAFPRTVRSCLAAKGAGVTVETSERWTFSPGRITRLEARLADGSRVLLTYEPDDSLGFDGYYGRYRMTVTPRL